MTPVKKTQFGGEMYMFTDEFISYGRDICLS